MSITRAPGRGASCFTIWTSQANSAGHGRSARLERTRQAIQIPIKTASGIQRAFIPRASAPASFNVSEAMRCVGTPNLRAQAEGRKGPRHLSASPIDLKPLQGHAQTGQMKQW